MTDWNERFLESGIGAALLDSLDALEQDGSAVPPEFARSIIEAFDEVCCPVIAAAGIFDTMARHRCIHSR